MCDRDRIGTYSGGWRIIRTLGAGLTHVKPAQGFAAETSTAATILASTHLGFALSTTQVASGSVIGSGLGRKGSTVRWRTVGRIASGWLFTLPAAAIVGAVAALIAHIGFWGIIIDAVLGLCFILFIFWRSRRNKVDAGNAIAVPDVAESGYAMRMGKGRVKKVPTKTGTVPTAHPGCAVCCPADKASGRPRKPVVGGGGEKGRQEGRAAAASGRHRMSDVNWMAFVTGIRNLAVRSGVRSSALLAWYSLPCDATAPGSPP